MARRNQDSPRGERRTEPPPDATVGARLLQWFDVHRRDLPWRRTRDPWAIWVSEVMLQQTRVETVREPFVRFLATYPTPAAFARASDDELFAAWRGLGYYRRARLLRDGAREVVERHGGRVPAALTELAELPGIGAYTLGAVGSIAFDHAVVAIDGNVERVVARHRGLREAIATATTRRVVREIVEGWLPKTRPGAFNQAVMELGATVCKPGTPECGRCPVATDCIARAQGATAELPVRTPRRPPVDVQARVVLIVDGGRALGHRLAANEPNAGQVELPGAGVLQSCDAADLPRRLQERFGAVCTIGHVLAEVRHAITHHRIVLHAHAGALRRRGSLTWFPLDAETPWTTTSRKVFARALPNGDAKQQA